MAMSISRAFLVAGARRVVASQWNVDDEAGCEFVRRFFDPVARRWKAGRPVRLCRRDGRCPAELRKYDGANWPTIPSIGPPSS